jgi:hypothetical protein
VHAVLPHGAVSSAAGADVVLAEFGP